MKNLNHNNYQNSRLKTPFKLTSILKSSDEMILNIRKHTIPIPFDFRSSQRECRELLTQKHHTKKAANTQRSSSRLVRFSPNKLTPKSIDSQLSHQDRPSTCSPNKFINIIEKAFEDKSRANVHLEWRKILACVKKSSDVVISTHTGTKKKPKLTIDKIIRNELALIN